MTSQADDNIMTSVKAQSVYATSISDETADDAIVLDNPEPQHYFVLSLLVAVFFNVPLGAVAMYLSWKAMKYFESGDCKTGRRRAKAAFYISMLGMVISSCLVIISVFYMAYYSKNK